MNFIRKLILRISNLFSEPSVPRPIIDVSKIHYEFEDIPELPREFIAEPFYTSMFSEDLVETPLFSRVQTPTPQELLEPQQLVDMATDIDTQH